VLRVHLTGTLKLIRARSEEESTEHDKNLTYPDTLLTKHKILRASQVILSMWAREEIEEVKVKPRSQKCHITAKYYNKNYRNYYK